MPSVENASPRLVPTPKRSSEYGFPSPSFSSEDYDFARDVGWTRATHEPDGGEYLSTQAGPVLSESESESENSSPSSTSRDPSNTKPLGLLQRFVAPQTPTRTPKSQKSGGSAKRELTGTPRLLFETGLDFSPICPSPLVLDKELRNQKLHERGFVEVPKAEVEYTRSLREIQRVKKQHQKSLSEIESMELQLLEKQKLMEEERRRLKGKRREPTTWSSTKGKCIKRKPDDEPSHCRKNSKQSHIHVKKEQDAVTNANPTHYLGAPPNSDVSVANQTIPAGDMSATQKGPLDAVTSHGHGLFIGHVPLPTTENDLRSLLFDYTM